MLLAAHRASSLILFLHVVSSVCRLQVALVFPNNDPVMFMVAFYGCLLAELVPVPIEVPLTRKVKVLRTKSALPRITVAHQ